MHKNPIAILLTIVSLIVVIIFLYAIYKVYKQNIATPDPITGDYVITDDGAQNSTVQDGAVPQQTSRVAQKSLTAQEAVSAVITASQQNIVQDTPPVTFTQEESATSPAPSATTVAVPSATSPATGPGTWVAMIAAVSALAAAMIGYKTLHCVRVQ